MSKKITEQELEKLQGLVQKLNSVITDLGVLETQKHNLLHAFANIQGEQEKTKTAIEDKHGKINVNLEDGSFEKIEGEE